MTASAGRQRTIIRQHKYPNDDEAAAPRLYYQPARDRIVRYHRQGHKVAWLLAQAEALDEKAGGGPDRAAVRLRHNANALRAYAQNFGDRRFEILSPLKLSLQYSDVRISAAPDLHVRENGTEKIIKLDFGAKEQAPEIIKVISQGMFEAARLGGHEFTTKDVLYLDVMRGRSHRGARLGARLGGDIEATCLNISAIWETL